MVHKDIVQNTYEVHFICDADDDYFWEARFVCTDKGSVKNLIAACAGHNSGDPCQCFINGQEAVLDGDWGLLVEPTSNR